MPKENIHYQHGDESPKIPGSKIITAMMAFGVENLSTVRYILAVRELEISDSKGVSEYLNVDRTKVFSFMRRLEKISLVNVTRKRKDGGRIRAFYTLSEAGEEFLKYFKKI